MSEESERLRPATDIEKWIADAHNGNREALGRLLDMCRHYLLLVANKEVAPALWAKVAPSDIVQDTLMAAGHHFPQFHGSSEEELIAWLCGILRNHAANVRRQFETEKRQIDLEIHLDHAPPEELASDPTESPSKQALAHEQDEQLEKALQQLPESYRQVIRLHSLGKLTFVQIAAEMDSSADAVRKLWGRAVEELAKQLDTPHDSTGCSQ